MTSPSVPFIWQLEYRRSFWTTGRRERSECDYQSSAYNQWSARSLPTWHDTGHLVIINTSTWRCNKEWAIVNTGNWNSFHIYTLRASFVDPKWHRTILSGSLIRQRPAAEMRTTIVRCPTRYLSLSQFNHGCESRSPRGNLSLTTVEKYWVYSSRLECRLQNNNNNKNFTFYPVATRCVVIPLKAKCVALSVNTFDKMFSTEKGRGEPTRAAVSSSVWSMRHEQEVAILGVWSTERDRSNRNQTQFTVVQHLSQPGITNRGMKKRYKVCAIPASVLTAFILYVQLQDQTWTGLIQWLRR